FLIAVFFLYAFSRWGGRHAAWARIPLMVLLGDLIVMLVAKDPDALWDPIGGLFCPLPAGGDPPDPTGSVEMFVRWGVGSAVLASALAVGRYAAPWIASEKGQQWIARGMVVVLAGVGVTVAVASSADALDEVTVQIVRHGHLFVLAILGI